MTRNKLEFETASPSFRTGPLWQQTFTSKDGKISEMFFYHSPTGVATDFRLKFVVHMRKLAQVVSENTLRKLFDIRS